MDLLAHRHEWNARHHAPTSFAAHTPIVNPTERKPTAYAKRDGRTIPVILPPAAWTSTNVMHRYKDHQVVAGRMPCAQTRPVVTRANVRQVSLAMRPFNASTWMNARNPIVAVPERHVAMSPVRSNAVAPMALCPILIRRFVALPSYHANQIPNALAMPFVMNATDASVPCRMLATIAAIRARQCPAVPTPTA